jgi:hypothetical protein
MVEVGSVPPAVGTALSLLLAPFLADIIQLCQNLILYLEDEWTCLELKVFPHFIPSLPMAGLCLAKL